MILQSAQRGAIEQCSPLSQPEDLWYSLNIKGAWIRHYDPSDHNALVSAANLNRALQEVYRRWNACMV